MINTECGWEKLDCTSYYVNTEKKNNKDAEADCISKGGKLFEPRNAKHNAFVTRLAEKKGLNGFWIGIHDKKENGKENEGNFVYESDNKAITWKNWLPGQPNNVYNKCYGDEDCVEGLCPKGKWNDQCCGKRKPYVCERMVYSGKYFLIFKSNVLFLFNKSVKKSFKISSLDNFFSYLKIHAGKNWMINVILLIL